MAEITLKVDPRTETGRKVKRLRRSGFIPGNIFGGKIKSIAIQVKTDVFDKVFQAAGETSLIYLTIDDEKTKRPVLISGVQRHPVYDQPIHVDFHQVDLTQTVTANIPLEIIGISPAETDNGAIIVQLVNEVEVEALPTDLPEKFEIDQSQLTEIGQMICVKDIKVDSKIKIKNDPEQQIVQAQEPQKEEEPAPVPEAEATAGEAETAPTEVTSPESTEGSKPE